MCVFGVYVCQRSVRIFGKDERVQDVLSEDIDHIRKLGKRKDIFGTVGRAAPWSTLSALPCLLLPPASRARALLLHVHACLL